MISSHQHSLSLLLLLLLLFLSALMSISMVQARAMVTQKASNNSIPAIFVFGDSTVDPGNNNYIETAFKSNFPPYGEDFVNHVPTGRFTNGRLATDFIASYLGVKEYVPPYLDPMLSMEELMTGVSFASAVSGYDPLTAQLSNVIQMSHQLEYFREYKSRVEQAIGKKRTDDLIKKAMFVVSAGTNDFIINYFMLPIRRKSYTVSSYQLFLMQNIQQFIQSQIGDCPSYEREKLRSLSISPPAMIAPATVNLTAVDDSRRRMLFLLRPSLAETGFDEVSRGCCGTGLLEGSFLCNIKSPVCFDVSKYIFWDAVHLTERAYYNIFKAAQSTIDSIIKD